MGRKVINVAIITGLEVINRHLWNGSGGNDPCLALTSSEWNPEQPIGFQLSVGNRLTLLNTLSQVYGGTSFISSFFREYADEYNK